MPMLGAGRGRSKRIRYLRPQTHMYSAMIVMKYPTVENMLEMSLSQRDEEIQTLSADGSHHTFAWDIRFGRSTRCPQDAHVHSRYGLIQFSGEDAVPDVVVQDFAPAQFHENEYI